MISLTECSVCKSKKVHVGRMVRPGWLWVWVVLSAGGLLVVCPVEVECKDCGAKMAAQELPPPLWALGFVGSIFSWSAGNSNSKPPQFV